MILIKSILYFPIWISYVFSKNKNIIQEDLKANGYNNNSEFINFILAAENKYFRSLFYFRVRNLYTKVLRVFYRKEKYLIFDIRSEIGGGVHLAHPFATIINAEKIGKNLYLNHLVTIGEKNGFRPIIGNMVQIHANASIIGGITIGNNVIIGAGAVVVKNVPNNSIVIGNPMKIIPLNN